jgi:hypothetical protein
MMDSFWHWYFKGIRGNPSGLDQHFSRWTLLHIGVGITLAYFVRDDLQKVSNSALLPLAGILIGLTFSWSGNAQALLQTREIESLSEYHDGGYQEYVFSFQAAILFILNSLQSTGIKT